MTSPSFVAPKPESDIDFSGTTAVDVTPPAFVAPDPKGGVPPRKGIFAKKAPEKKAAAPRAAKKTEPPSKKGEFKDDLMALYATAAMGIGLKDPECAKTIIENGEKCAESWDELAQKNESVRKVLRTLTATSAWSAVIMAHMPIAMAVMAHHGPGFAPAVPHATPEEEKVS